MGHPVERTHCTFSFCSSILSPLTSLYKGVYINIFLYQDGSQPDRPESRFYWHVSRYLPLSNSSHFTNQSLSKNVRFIKRVMILCVKDTNASFSLSDLKHLQDTGNNKLLHISSAKIFNDLFKLSAVWLYHSLIKSNILWLNRKAKLPVDSGDLERRNYRRQIKVYLFLVQQPAADQGLLILEVSRSHTTTHHSLQDSSGRVISSSQRSLPDNTKHSQQTNTHDPSGISNPQSQQASGRRPTP